MRTSIAAPYMLSRAGPCSLGIPARHHERHPAAHLSLFQLLAVASRRSIDDPLATCQRPVSDLSAIGPLFSQLDVLVQSSSRATQRIQRSLELHCFSLVRRRIRTIRLPTGPIIRFVPTARRVPHSATLSLSMLSRVLYGYSHQSSRPTQLSNFNLQLSQRKPNHEETYICQWSHQRRGTEHCDDDSRPQ